jgi:DNA-binding FadR family transcriptional regulator
MAATRSPAPARNAHGRTLDSLGEAIVAGRYPPGSSIPPEPLLCEELGVSRTVVREAIKSLVAKGLISTGPKVGTRVLAAEHWNTFDAEVVGWHARSGLGRDFVMDLQELRRVVEPAAVRLAAERASAEDLSALQAAYDEMALAIEQGGDYLGPDLAFHQTLLRASGNRLLQQMGRVLGTLLRASFELSSSRRNAPAQSLPLHRTLLDAVARGQPARAERACLELIDSAQADIEHVLSRRRKLPAQKQPAAPLKRPAAG